MVSRNRIQTTTLLILIYARMKAYIINLRESIQRREYVKQMLTPYLDRMQIDFVEAFDGRKISESELAKIFNQRKAFSIYGRTLIGPEVGCTMSHRICQRKMIENSESAALIFEDDLVLPTRDIYDNLEEIYTFVSNSEKPVIVLLSGDYWFTSVKRIGVHTRIAKVREAVCSHAYFINKKAAEIILSLDIYHLADDWYSLKQEGISIFGAYPHFADQNRRDLNTEISDQYVGFIRKNLSLQVRIASYYRAIVKRLLVYVRHFEAKSFVR